MDIRECSELDTQISSVFSAHHGEGSPVLEYNERLVNDLSSVRQARHKTEALLDEFSPSLRDTAALLVSEIVTNALIHTSGDVAFTVRVSEGHMRVEVDDSSTRRLRRRVASTTSPGGRGLELVEMLSSRWGVITHSSGKKVWFELEEEDVEGLRQDARRSFRVVLPSAPAALVARTIEHLDQVLREVYVDSGEYDSYSSISEIELSALQLQARAALARGIDVVDMHVSLPPSASEIASATLEVLEAADEKARRGALLCPPATEDVALCRKWILTEIADQAKAPHPVLPRQER